MIWRFKKIWLRIFLLIGIWLFCAVLSWTPSRAQDDLTAAFSSSANLPTVSLAKDTWLQTPREPTTALAAVVVDSRSNLDAASIDDATDSHRNAREGVQSLDISALEQSYPVRVGYDDGFVIASKRALDFSDSDDAYRLVINGWGQLRDTVFDSKGAGSDLNQLQLKRARLVLSGHAFTPEFRYFVQLDGRSNSGDAVRILDYFMTYDVGHRNWNFDRDTIGFKTGLYKMPFSLARQLSGKEFQFADRSMSSTYFDVNRSLAWGLYGKVNALIKPIFWEAAVFNGLVTGGAETGSSGNLDNNNAVSARAYCFPSDEWESGQLADLTIHESLATRVGAGFAFTTVDRSGSTEFDALRSVDSGVSLATLLPLSVTEYDVALYSVDGSMKFRGVSATCEYYIRNLSGFHGAELANLFDHGLWLQMGYFVVPRKIELLSRWSRVQGSTGSLGLSDQSSEEVAGGFVVYFKEQQAKLTVDASYLNGASISSSTLDISAGDIGWLYRTQLQFSF